MAGIKLAAGDKVLFFGAAAPDDSAAVVVTIAGTDGALPGTAPGAAKVTALAEYPAKGRATAGVRAHRFLKGEDTLLLAWAGHGPAKASSLAGVARSLPEEHGRRDGSGIPLSQAVDAVGSGHGLDGVRPLRLTAACLSSRITRTGPGCSRGPARSAVSTLPRSPRPRCRGAWPACCPAGGPSCAGRTWRNVPDEHTWSVLEYACHVRDVFACSTTG